MLGFPTRRCTGGAAPVYLGHIQRVTPRNPHNDMTASSDISKLTARALRCLIDDCRQNTHEVETREIVIDALRIIASEGLPADHCRALATSLQSLVVFGDREASTMRGVLLMAAKDALRDVEAGAVRTAFEALNNAQQPRILECESDWKVSPHGDADPDRDCYWVETHEEALAELRALGQEPA